MICTDIKLAVKKAGIKNIFLTGVCGDAQTEELKKLFEDKLKTAMEEVSCGKSVVYNPDALERLAEAGGVVLFERVDVSAYSDIAKELELCKRYEIPVIGCVVVE